MLIRLVSHHVGNSDHIDKLIYIEGLPESLLFRTEGTKKYLIEPWEIDVDENIPDDIKRVYYKHPTKVFKRYPITYTPAGVPMEAVEDEFEVSAIRIDYQSGPGEQTWKRIERILDRETPRDQKVPVPAVVGNRQQWTLTASDVPAVVLPQTIPEGASIERPAPTTIKAEEKPKDKPVTALFYCDQCDKSYQQKQSLYMHKYHHHKKQKAVA